MSSKCLIVKMKHVMLFKVHAFDCSKHNTVHIPYSTWIYKQRSTFRLPLSESIQNSSLFYRACGKVSQLWLFSNNIYHYVLHTKTPVYVHTFTI